MQAQVRVGHYAVFKRDPFFAIGSLWDPVGDLDPFNPAPNTGPPTSQRIAPNLQMKRGEPRPNLKEKPLDPYPKKPNPKARVGTPNPLYFPEREP